MTHLRCDIGKRRNVSRSVADFFVWSRLVLTKRLHRPGNDTASHAGAGLKSRNGDRTMKSLNPFGRYLALVVVGLLIAGCDGWSYSPPLRGNYYSSHVTVPDAQGTAPSASASAFNQVLAHDYADFAGV
ncbi:MAG: hypothetical protein ACREEA_08910, partial [Stellaceae bacterium]